MQNEAAVYLPLNKVKVIDGFNPRRFFDPTAIEELAASIRTEGVIQPIVVRPMPDESYAVIAGERRWRAAQVAGLSEIPAVVRDVDEKHALVIAGIENMKRDNMGPAEEAEFARRVLEQCDGELPEALRLVGWTHAKFQSRMLLLHASAKVIAALNERRIKLGHAELLSTLPVATQDGTLDQIIERDISVTDLRDKVAAFALDLATACFDTAACMRCAHNTTRQATLFEQNIGEGRCTNKVCFTDKSKTAVEQKREALKEKHNAVWLDVEKSPGSWRILLKNAVGVEQYNNGCKGCKSFGVLLSTAPGSMGAVTEDVCGNLACYEEKNAAIAKPTVTHSPTAAPSGKTAATRATAETPRSKSTEVSNEAPKRVQEYAAEMHRRAASIQLRTDPAMVKVYAIIALLEQIGELHFGSKDNDPLSQFNITRPKASGNERAQLISSLYARADDVLDPLTVELCARVALGQGRTATDPAYLDAARTTLRVLDAPLAKHWKLDKAFLETHTKSGIEALMNESGFTAYFNSLKKDKNASADLVAKKKDELIDAVLNSGFDFSGFIPASCALPKANKGEKR